MTQVSADIITTYVFCMLAFSESILLAFSLANALFCALGYCKSCQLTSTLSVCVVGAACSPQIALSVAAVRFVMIDVQMRSSSARRICWCNTKRWTFLRKESSSGSQVGNPLEYCIQGQCTIRGDEGCRACAEDLSAADFVLCSLMARLPG